MPTPSLLIVPARFKSGKLYSQIPTSGAGDFTVTRATAATRVNASGLIESVASGIPRLDYFASGGTVGCPALLVEPSAQNLALQSRDLSQAVWVKTNVTAVKNAVGADGVASGATTLTATAASGTVLQAIVNISQSRVFSAYVRRVTGTGAVEMTTNGGTNWTAVTISSTYTQVACAAQTVLNGSVGFRMAVSGDVIEVDFTQSEVGPAFTSPIPTTTASVTRNAEVISVTGASGSIGQTEGTMYAEFFVDFNNRDADIFSVDGGSTSDGFFMSIRSSSVVQLIVRTASANALIFQRTGTYPTGVNKLAVAYKNGDFAICLNGTTVQTNTSSITMPSVSINRASLCRSSLYNLNQQIRIRAAALYTTRLTNDQLAALTTP